MDEQFKRNFQLCSQRTLPVWIVLLPPLARANIWIFFSDERAEFIDFDEGVGLGLWWAGGECLGGLYQPARDGLVMDPKLCRSLASPSLRDRVDKPVAGRRDLCLVVLLERTVGRLGNGSVGRPGWCHSESSPDERSEDIAWRALQI